MAAGRDGSARKGRPVGTTKTQRLRRLECDDCGYLAYVSRRWIATGLPGCPCGGTLMPEDPDDARLALSDDELAQHPFVIDYMRELSRVSHGQAPHGRKGRQLRPAEEIAAERVERERRQRARERQLSGLRRGSYDPTSGEQPPGDPIPF